jgi:hypothetical protein
MPVPRIFVSSTCYDLRYVRENLRHFIESLGYEPVLSERGGVYYDPRAHVQQAAIAEVAQCQMLVLVIGGRRGSSSVRDPTTSVTNLEYKAACDHQIPIFALVDRDVLAQYRVFCANRANPKVDRDVIAYPAVDSTNIFQFIHEVESHVINNALMPFSDFEEMRSYLCQQWAFMLHEFLSVRATSDRVAVKLADVEGLSRRIEFLTSEVLNVVGKNFARAVEELYDLLIGSPSRRTLFLGKARVTPDLVLRHPTLSEFFEASGVLFGPPLPRTSKASLEYKPEVRHLATVHVTEVDDAGALVGRVRMTEDNAAEENANYVALRQQMVERLNTLGIRVDDFLARQGADLPSCSPPAPRGD